jgi:ketosteroid isomerase-like protein
MTEVETDTRAVVDALYEAYLAGDSEGMLTQMADDVEVRFLAQGTFSAGLLHDLDFRIRRKIVDGDAAAVIWDESATTSDGKAWENHGVDVIRVRNGKIVALHENNDINLVYEHFPRYDPESEAE